MKKEIGTHVEIVTSKANGYVILVNTINHQWLRISKETFTILIQLLDAELIDDIERKFFQTSEDYQFIKGMIAELEKMNVINFLGEKHEVSNETVSIEITHRCNLHCTHCCMNASNSMKEEADLSFEQMKEMIDKIVEWNPKRIMLSGGEPMLRGDFFLLLSYLRSIFNGTIILSTNGTFINQKNADQLVKMVDQFEISIDGIDEATCAVVRGRGVFKKVIRSIEVLKEFHATVIHLSMVFSDKTEHLLEPFYKLNEKLGTTPVCRLFSPTGRGEVNKQLFTDKTEFETYIPSDYMTEDSEKFLSICSCTAGKRELFIDYEGNIYPCPNYIRSELKMGNIFEIDKLFDLTQNEGGKISVTLDKVDPKNSEKCSDCEVKLFCWTCPAAIDDFKTEESMEDNCRQIKPMLMKRVWNS
ncbi:MAG: radical SAM protein [Enterococcus sp.]